MSESGETYEWHPIRDIPRDGRVVLGSNDIGVMAPIFLDIVPDKTVETKRWWGRKRTKTIEGGAYLAIACPYGDGYGCMNIRRDFGWKPTKWREMPTF